MIYGLDTGFLVAAEVTEHAEHSAARQMLPLRACLPPVKWAREMLAEKENGKGCSADAGCEETMIELTISSAKVDLSPGSEVILRHQTWAMRTMQKPVAGLLFLAWLAFGAPRASALELVRNGIPLAEIVVPEKALPQVNFAARELQEHIKKISGAELPLVAVPSPGSTRQIYVGESEHTRKLGLSTDDLKMEGFKIVADDEYLALVGRDAVFPPYPRGHHTKDDFPRLLKQWQEYCGEPWDFPWRNFYDPRNYCPQLGFSLYDPTGTLFAVYEFLEQLGVRWYLPYHEFGTVVPQCNEIVVEKQVTTRNPEFAFRQIWFSFPAGDVDGFLWFKRQKLGMSEMTWIGHGTPYVTRFTQQEHPEYLSVIGGRIPTQTGGHESPGHPRLAPPLREAMIRFGTAFFDRYPELRYFSSAPADGYIQIDDRDQAAGWWQEERGPRGVISDYVWKFVDEVARGVAQKHPEKIVMGLAYSGYRTPPGNIRQFSPNVGVAYCQSRSQMVSPEERRQVAREREQWLAMLPSGEFLIWEYYLYYRDRDRLAGVPVVFTRIMQEDARALRGKSKGEYVECWGGTGKLPNPGLNHLNIVLQARLYWDPDLDLEAFLSEYCERFYGPARREMQEFLAFAEEVWMRPGSRDVYADDAFLKPADVDRYFDLLHRARAKAGDSVYGKRIDLMIAECQPARELLAHKDHFQWGVAAARDKDGTAAEESLRKAVASAKDPRSRVGALVELGRVYRSLLHDNAKALEAYRQATQVQFSGAGSALRYQARMACVTILREEKRFDEAAALLDEFSQEASRHAYWKVEMLQAYGQIAEDRGRTDDALARYTEALSVAGISAGQAKALQGRVRALERAAAGKRPMP